MIIIISIIIYLPKCIVIKNWGHKTFLKGCYRRHEFRHKVLRGGTNTRSHK